LSAEGFRGGEHQDAAEAVALEARHHTDLRGVADTGGNFAGQDSPGKLVALRMMQDKRSVRQKLAATGEQDNVLEEFQRAVPRAVLVGFPVLFPASDLASPMRRCPVPVSARDALDERSRVLWDVVPILCRSLLSSGF